MGNKGQRRREKNYLAAHGGHSRLPPPPKTSDFDSIPSKLRKLMSFMSPPPISSSSSPSSNITTSTTKHQDDVKVPKNAKSGKTKGDNVGDQNKARSSDAKFKEKPGHENAKTVDLKDNGDESADINRDDKKKRKRKRKTATDLRLGNVVDLAAAGLSKRQRRKNFLKERKKKHKKPKTDDIVDFPKREEIMFGEVVQGPPKLVALPKGTKTPVDASHERLRLQAVEDYRKRRGWESRPGVQIPSIGATLSS